MSGAEPFGGENIYAVTYRLLHEDPAPLSVLVPGIDPDIVTIVTKALQRAPEARFQDAEEMRKSFAAVRARLETDTDATMLRYVPSVQARRPAASGAGTPSPDPRTRGAAFGSDEGCRGHASPRAATHGS